MTFDKNRNEKRIEQIDLFSDINLKEREIHDEKLDNELQKILLSIKEKYGKNSILKGIDLEKCATTVERNNQIGGHKK